jgi:hypothetical protein
VINLLSTKEQRDMVRSLSPAQARDREAEPARTYRSKAGRLAPPAYFSAMSLPTLRESCHDIRLSRLHPDRRSTRHDMPTPKCAFSEANQAATSS